MTESPERQINQAVFEVLTKYPVIDGHNDLAWRAREQAGYDLDRLDLRSRQPSLHTDIPRLKRGQVGTQLWSVFVPSSMSPDEAVRAVLEQIDFIHQICARYPETFTFARTAEDARAAMRSGRIASMLGAEGGHSINESLAVLRILATIGVRYMTLTHMESIAWADSATDDPRAAGLTDFGVEVVQTMNQLGMLVDLSHVSTQTMHAALDHSRAPVIFSHSSCQAVTNHPRNVPDDVLLRLSANGGLCGISFPSEFVSQAVVDWQSALTSLETDLAGVAEPEAERARWLSENPRPRAKIADVADHLDHARDVAGIDHIGIGGDYDGCPELPDGLEDVAGYPKLFAELMSRGWSSGDLAKVAHTNFLRVLEDGERSLPSW